MFVICRLWYGVAASISVQYLCAYFVIVEREGSVLFILLGQSVSILLDLINNSTQPLRTPDFLFIP